MNWVSGIAVYVCIWWVVIFAVLPWGVRTAEPNDEGFDAGAPENPRFGMKVVVTTAITTVLWLVFYVIASSNLITFRGP
jgi:predicted secreted protein